MLCFVSCFVLMFPFLLLCCVTEMDLCRVFHQPLARRSLPHKSQASSGSFISTMPTIRKTTREKNEAIL
jgi:hypothetical protein